MGAYFQYLDTLSLTHGTHITPALLQLTKENCFRQVQHAQAIHLRIYTSDKKNSRLLCFVCSQLQAITQEGGGGLTLMR